MSKEQEAADWINAKMMLIPMMPSEDMLKRAHANIVEEAVRKFGIETVQAAKPILERYQRNRAII